MPLLMPGNAALRAVYGNRELPVEMIRRFSSSPQLRGRLLQLILESLFYQEVPAMYAVSGHEGTIVFPAREYLINPDEFFHRQGIRLYGSFEQCVLPAFESASYTPRRRYRTKYSPIGGHDSFLEIFQSLPEPRLSHWTDFASLIELYPCDKISYLLFLEGVNGEVFPVTVGRCSGHRGVAIFRRQLSKNDRLEIDRVVLSPINQADAFFDP